MKLCKFGSLLIISVLSGVSVAAPKTSVISLPGGQATYNQVVYVDLGKLLLDVKYEISCDITSNNISHQEYNDIQVGSEGKAELYVNEMSVGANNFNGQVSIPSNKVSELVALAYSYGGRIGIRNLDDTDTITVSNCKAKPITVG